MNIQKKISMRCVHFLSYFFKNLEVNGSWKDLHLSKTSFSSCDCQNRSHTVNMGDHQCWCSRCVGYKYFCQQPFSLVKPLTPPIVCWLMINPPSLAGYSIISRVWWCLMGIVPVIFWANHSLFTTPNLCCFLYPLFLLVSPPNRS